MHSLKSSCVGQIFALARPHDSVGKRTRNRIPKEERKALVESFIKKHQNLNNGSFPSLSLTHKEVGGSFYTIREIVREIIQENRVLGPGDLIFEGKGSNHLQDQSLSSSIPMDPVPPLSLSPVGFHSALDQSHTFSSEDEETKSPENGENINGSQVSPEDRGYNQLNRREVNGNQVFKEDVELPIHQAMDYTDISKTQFAASFREENDAKHDTGLQNKMQTVCDSSATNPQDKELSVDSKDRGFEEIPFIESQGIIDLPPETVAETLPLRSVTSTMESSDVQPTELDKVCEGGKETEEMVETDSSIITSVDLVEISSSTSALPEEQGTEVIAVQMPNPISAPMEKTVEEKILNPASIDVECDDTKGTVVMNAVIDNIHETKEFSNGTLTTEQKTPESGTESGSCKNDTTKVETVSSHARNKATSVENSTMEKGKRDDSDSFSSQKGNLATLNRIKPESWKGQTNLAGQETNPLLAVLKSFLTAFVKFWSE